MSETKNISDFGNLKATCIHQGENQSVLLSVDQTESLQTILQGKCAIIDLWTATCTRCPGELSNLNEYAQVSGSTQCSFIGILLCKEDSDVEVAREMAEETTNLSHWYVDSPTREALKSIFGFTSVPVTLIIDGVGNVQNISSLSREQVQEKKKQLLSGVPLNIPTAAPLVFDEEF